MQKVVVGKMHEQRIHYTKLGMMREAKAVGVAITFLERHQTEDKTDA